MAIFKTSTADRLGPAGALQRVYPGKARAGALGWGAAAAIAALVILLIAASRSANIQAGSIATAASPATATVIPMESVDCQLDRAGTLVDPVFRKDRRAAAGDDDSDDATPCPALLQKKSPTPVVPRHALPPSI